MASCEAASASQREEALAAAHEATEVRRKLALARPDAFLPDLALSLNNLSAMLSELGQWEEAIAASVDAIRALSALFLRQPPAFAGLMRTAVLNYRARCQELGREPDHGLIGPVEEVLQRLNPTP